MTQSVTREELVRAYSGIRCLVTGHTGFKGSWLSLWLHQLGAEVYGCALEPPSKPNLFELAKVGDLVHDTRQDINDFQGLRDVIQTAQPKIVFHLAAQAILRESYGTPIETFLTNVMGTAHVLEAARKNDAVRAMIMVTSDKCYENNEWHFSYRENDRLGGFDPYSASKAAAEHAVGAWSKSFYDHANVGVASVRAGNVVGGGDWATDRIVPDLVRAVMSNEALTVRHPEAIRPWLHVMDPLYGYLALGVQLLRDPARYSGPWNFGPASADHQTVRALVEEILTHLGRGEWRDVSNEQGDEWHEATMLALSWDKAHRRLGWHPQWSFATLAQRTGKWYRLFFQGNDARELCLTDIDAYERTLS